MCRGLSLLLVALFNASILVPGLHVHATDASSSRVVPLDDSWLGGHGEWLGGEDDLMPPPVAHRTRGGRQGLPMRRIRSEQAALEKKLLQKELRKLPFTQRQLGEGVAMKTALKEKAAVSFDVDKSFKKVDTITALKKRVADQKTSFEKVKSGLEKKELTARQVAADLRKKVRSMVSKDKYEKLRKQVEKDRSKVKEMKTEVSQVSQQEKEEKQKAERIVAKATSEESKTRQDAEQKVEQSEEREAEEVASKKEDVKKKYYVDMAQVDTWKKKITDNEGRMQELRDQIKDLQKGGKDSEKAMEAKEQQDLAAVKSEDRKKLEKEKEKEKGFEQKLEWDKRTVNKAKIQEKKEATVMAVALGRNDKLRESEQAEQSKFKEEQRRAHLKSMQDTSKLNRVEVSEAVAREKAKESTERIENIRIRAAEKMKEDKEEGAAGVKSVQDNADKKIEDLKSKVRQLEDKVQSVKSIEASNVQKDVTKKMMSEQAHEQKMENTLRGIEDQAQLTLKAKIRDDEKVESLKASLEDERQHEASILAKEKEDTAGFKTVLANEEKSLKKRVGSRQTAALLQRSLVAKTKELKTTEKDLKAQQEQLQSLSEGNSNLEKKSDEYRQKLGHAQYRVAMEKEKYDQLSMDFKKLTLKHQLLKQQKGKVKISESGNKVRAELYENKYKVQIKVSQASDKEVELMKARARLLYTKNARSEAKAQQFKTEKDEEIAHGQRVADAVRAKWSTKLVNEEVKHSKSVLKMKHELEKVELESEKNKVKADKRVDKAKQIAANEGNKAKNMKIAEKFTTELVGRQEVKAGVMQEYVKNMDKIRERYNNQYQEEYEAEIKNLKDQIASFKNSKKFVKQQYEILLLKNQLKNAKKGTATKGNPQASNGFATSSSENSRAENSRTVDVEQRSIGIDEQRVDLSTMLAAAIKRVEKKAAHMTVAEQRRRLNAVINSIVADHTIRQQAKANGIVDAVDTALLSSKSMRIKTSKAPAPSTPTTSARDGADTTSNSDAVESNQPDQRLGESPVARLTPSYVPMSQKWGPSGSAIEIVAPGQQQELKVGALLFDGNQGGSSITST